MQNLSTTCWLLSETWAATWASRCTTYFHIWTGSLRSWFQWVTSRGRDSIRTWKRWRSGIRVTGTQSLWSTTVGIWRETSLPLSIPGVQRNRSSRSEVWTMVKQNAIYVYLYQCHHSVYSNQCFYQVINTCCWQNIFSLKNIFRMVCVDKNQLIMPQKCNLFCHEIWFFSNQLSTKTWPDGEKRMPFPDSAAQKYPKSVVEI